MFRKLTCRNVPFFLFALISVSAVAQEGNWDAYMAQYEDGPGSTVLNMDLIKNAPNKKLPFLLVTGVQFSGCREDGLPEKSQFDVLYEISDKVLEFLNTYGTFEHAGTFTYQCERLDYFYVNDTVALRNKLSDLYSSYFSRFVPYISIKNDSKWDVYSSFLYPNDVILEHMANQKVLMQLQKSGDDLTKPRKVDHWIYFSNKSDRKLFIEHVVKEGFIVEDDGKVKNSDWPYQLRISRSDYVYPESIDKITVFLKMKAKEFNGEYDGWESMVVTN